MSGKIYNAFEKLSTLQILIIGVLISEVLTFLISYAASKMLWGKMPIQVFIIGIIDSFFVSFVIVSLLLISIRTIKTLNKKLEKQNKELSSALAEIKTLQGILPICCYCKQIRNDKGYYEQLENYFHKHSGVDFSHTICPSCMKKHHPEVYAKESDTDANTVPE